MMNLTENQGALPREIVGRIALRERIANQTLREPVRRPARVAQVLTYAHCLQRAIERGDYRDYSHVAERLGYTKARITQMLNLILMDPSIQDEILHLESVDGLEPMWEHAIRTVSEERDWVTQRACWESVATHRRRRHLAV
jgi:hypothetical protein